MENSDKNNDKRLDNLKPFKKGESGNPNGRPKGSLNYATKMRKAIELIAESQHSTPEEIEELIYRTGIKEALKGDYQFYRDYMDRNHGRPVQPTDITTQGQAMQGVVILPAKEEADSEEK